MRPKTACTLIVLLAIWHLELALCQDESLLQQPLQRMAKRDKSNSNGASHNDDFEKFFLKASKSVPRIGRRGSEEPPAITEIKVPLWADLAELYEYNPELFSSPQLLARYLAYYNSQLSSDEAKLFNEGGWTKLRYKRTCCPDRFAASTSSSSQDELLEYRLQP